MEVLEDNTPRPADLVEGNNPVGVGAGHPGLPLGTSLQLHYINYLVYDMRQILFGKTFGRPLFEYYPVIIQGPQNQQSMPISTHPNIIPDWQIYVTSSFI